MGEDLTNTNRFNDKVLFGYLFCVYYPRYELESCYVAVDDKNSIVGYILGTTDTKNQEKKFSLKMVWRIFLRLLFYSSWRYPESFKAVIYIIKNAKYDKDKEKVLRENPAHLHINVLPEFQHSGTGAMLIETYEDYLKSKGVKGLHLHTSNHNIKALPFYNKRGYKVINRIKNELWSGIDDYESIAFAKRLCD
jgi:ribosomal protein S18 acetylase RimI-like enzyme